MSAAPLVSIAIPCHNSAALLPWALSSVLAQTYDDWECIVVDDGSIDHPEEVVAALDEPRIRMIRLRANVGRAAARQVALDAAAGDYLAKLDADDWIYPGKLSCQIEVMERMPHIALVSTGIAIEDENSCLTGVRARGGADCATVPPMQRLASPPLAHAPSMIRMHIARRYRYDTRLQRSEDAAYLLRLLREHSHCVMHDVLYVYREFRSTSQQDTLQAYRARMTMFWGFRNRYPVSAMLRAAETAAKWSLYRIAFAARRAESLIASRSDAPTTDDLRRFQEARARVQTVLSTRFASLHQQQTSRSIVRRQDDAP